MAPLVTVRRVPLVAVGAPTGTIPFGADEPRYTGVDQDLLHYEDFSGITPGSSAALEAAVPPGGNYYDIFSDVSGGYCWVQADSGFDGTRTGVAGPALVNHWVPPGVIGNEQRQGMEFNGVQGPAGASPVYHQYYYRAPGFNIGNGTFPFLGKKSYLVSMYGGTNSIFEGGRLTCSHPHLSQAWVNADGTLNGALKYDTNWSEVGPLFPDYQPGDNANSWVNRYLNNGEWHRITIERTPESAPGAGDGRIRIWYDSYLVEDVTMAVGTGNFHVVQIASTFNGGSQYTQDEFYDEWRIWSGATGVS